GRGPRTPGGVTSPRLFLPALVGLRDGGDRLPQPRLHHRGHHGLRGTPAQGSGIPGSAGIGGSVKVGSGRGYVAPGRLGQGASSWVAQSASAARGPMSPAFALPHGLYGGLCRSGGSVVSPAGSVFA